MADDQSEAPEPPEFRVDELFLPFAPWEQVAQAHWQHFNDDTGRRSKTCAFLGTDRSEKAAVKRWYDSKSGTIPWMEEAVRSADVLAGPGNYPDEIADPASGANILAFPVMEQAVAEGYTARNDAGDLLALVVGADEV
ncbi:hypothetical protein [Streptomonospora salina]|uniref:Uncharacterized protein n=2 Tax=Streptomonospora salina TaxID=104205 RepID=A0A841EAE0_9ACTN|nr:hypothetical protein [Streptomonospora salina]MBB5998033.1 hypothetical protein [Streptomonospora salina]